MKILVLNDQKMGHLNQSLALAKLSGWDYTVIDVRYKNRLSKLLSYLFDRLGIYTDTLFDCAVPEGKFDAVVSAGSTCAYPLKVLARRLGAKSVSMMLPRGYRYDYDVIFAQRHDHPPYADNIIEIPANFSFPEPRGLFGTESPAVGIVIGGNNAVFTLSAETLSQQLQQIFDAFQGYRFAVTTSPRTPKEVETMLERFAFDYKIIYSLDPVNPIPDFLEQCERVFITQDSTSMISEAVSFGRACIEVLPLEGEGENKFTRLISELEEGGYLHVFDGTFGRAQRKIDFRHYIEKMNIGVTV